MRRTNILLILTSLILSGVGPILLITTGQVNAASSGLPDPPTDLTVEPDDFGIYLNWTVPLDDGGSPITEYRVYKWDNETWPPVYGTWSFSGMTTTRIGGHIDVEDYYLRGNTTTYFYVTAMNGNGESTKSNEVNVTANFRPWRVSLITFEGGWWVTDWGNGYAYLDWEPPADDGGLKILYYEIQRSRQVFDESLGYDVSVDWQNVTVPGSQTEYLDESVSNGVEYEYAVHAVNSLGPGMGWVYPVTPGTPSCVGDLTAVGGNGTVELSWTAPVKDCGSPITHYAIQRLDWSSGYPYETVNFTCPGTQTKFVDTSAPNGHSLQYSVAACNALGGAGGVEVTSAMSHGDPSRPWNLTASWETDEAGKPFITVTWSPPDSATDIGQMYQVYKSGGMFAVMKLGCSGTSYVDSEVIEGVAYTYFVTTSVDEAESGPTEPITITPGYGSLAPQDLFAVPGKGFINLSWRPPYDFDRVVSYDVLRGTDADHLTKIASLSPGTLGLNDTDVKAGLTYYYSVKAIDNGNGFGTSGVVERTVAGTPASNGGSILWVAIGLVAIGIIVSSAIWIFTKWNGRKKLGAIAIVAIIVAAGVTVASSLRSDGAAGSASSTIWEPKIGDFFEYGYEYGDVTQGMKVMITSIGDTTMTVNITLLISGQDPYVMEQTWQKDSTMGMGLGQTNGADIFSLFSGGSVSNETLATEWGYLWTEHKVMWIEEMAGMPVNMTLEIWQCGNIIIQTDVTMIMDWGYGPPTLSSFHMLRLIDTNILQIISP
ncbi:MAG: Fibronectin type III domain protein [Methanomassiliicoccales archaeon PtaU1.Bin124]|nr:MAG: Fibronectin type III domain protein [Methanomassiliicoccales archaeon PtaU1.Bin124]